MSFDLDKQASACSRQTKVCFSNISEMQAFLSAFGGSLLWREPAYKKEP